LCLSGGATVDVGDSQVIAGGWDGGGELRRGCCPIFQACCMERE